MAFAVEIVAGVMLGGMVGWIVGWMAVVDSAGDVVGVVGTA